MSPPAPAGVHGRRPGWRAAAAGVCLVVVAIVSLAVLLAGPSRTTRLPASIPAVPRRPCTVTASSSSAATAMVGRAADGAVICLAGGRYAGLRLTGAHRSDVTLQPAPGQTVTVLTGITDAHGMPAAVLIEPGSAHLVIHDLRVVGTVEIGAGSSAIRIDHNDIGEGAFGVLLQSENCNAAHAPRWPGCGAEPVIRDVTISGNRIHDVGGRRGDDAINANHYAGLRITGNEITGIREGGHHTDCFQSTFGGSGLVFDHNYEHDNNCQGFFIKDGDVADALVYDNLFVRDQVEGQPEANLSIFGVGHLVIADNTSWSGAADVLRGVAGPGATHALVEHNVFQMFENGCCQDPTHFSLSERDNVFGRAPVSFTIAQSDRVGAPVFAAGDRIDEHLIKGAPRAGVDWLPRDRRYGPSS
jgi:Right handed beta helix region